MMILNILKNRRYRKTFQNCMVWRGTYNGKINFRKN